MSQKNREEEAKIMEDAKSVLTGFAYLVGFITILIIFGKIFIK